MKRIFLVPIRFFGLKKEWSSDTSKFKWDFKKILDKKQIGLNWKISFLKQKDTKAKKKGRIGENNFLPRWDSNPDGIILLSLATTPKVTCPKAKPFMPPIILYQ